MIFTSIRDFSVRLLFPAHAAEGLPFILEIPFLCLLCVVPPFFLFLIPCWNKGSIQSIPFSYSAVPADSRLHALGDGHKKDGNTKNKESKQAPRIYSPPLPLSSSCAQTRRNRHMRRDVRVATMYVFCSVPLHLFFLWLCLPPFSSLPLFASLCPSLSLDAARWFTQKLSALSWQLYACRDICECAYAGGLK